MKRIHLEEIQQQKKFETYAELYAHIMAEIAKGTIRPVKASGNNGKNPPLHLRYWLEEPEKDYSKLEEELVYGLSPMISYDYYLKNIPVYEQDRKWVIMLSTYLKEQRDLLKQPESINERSFEIWGQEKFLKKGSGMRILKNCGILPELLNYYDTMEPIAGYTHTKTVPQNILLLENKDTFYSMRRHLLEGNPAIMGLEIGSLIYGAGKGILKSFRDFAICAEPYMQNKANKLYYFGDLDFEGIGIYEKLAELYQAEYKITPFIPGYIKMLAKANPAILPETKEQQNRHITGQFFTFFSPKSATEMKQILEMDRYIPQEILNIGDF